MTSCDYQKVLAETYRFKIELHAHTSPVSPCSEIPPERMIEYYKALNYDAVVITNHFFRSCVDRGSIEKSIEYYLNDYKAAKKCGDTLGLTVILGMEARFPENINDYLVFGIDEADVISMYPYLSKSYEEFYNAFRSDDRVIVQAHSQRDRMELQKLDLLDGIEVFNMHPNHNSRIGMAAVLASENKDLLRTCGSDVHHPGQEGLCALRSKQLPTDSYEVAKLLRSRDYLFSIGDSLIFPYAQ